MIARTSSKGDNSLRALMGLYQGLSSRSLGSNSHGSKTEEDLIFNDPSDDEDEDSTHHEAEERSSKRTIAISNHHQLQDVSHSSIDEADASSFPLNGVLVICMDGEDQQQNHRPASQEPFLGNHNSKIATITKSNSSSRHSVVSVLPSDDESTFFGSGSTSIEGSGVFSSGSFSVEDDDSDMSEFGFTAEQRRSRRRLIVSDEYQETNRSQRGSVHSREHKTDLDASGHNRSRRGRSSSSHEQRRPHRSYRHHRHAPSQDGGPPCNGNKEKKTNTASSSVSSSIRQARRKMQHGGDHEAFCQRSKASSGTRSRRLRRPNSKPDPLHLLLTKNSNHGGGQQEHESAATSMVASPCAAAVTQTTATATAASSRNRVVE